MKLNASIVALLFMGSTGLGAQSMTVPPSAVKRGASGSLLLVIDSPAGKAPLALQWKFVFPAGVIVELKDMVAGGAAESSQKVLTCTQVAKQPKSGQAFTCILAAGQNAIPNGTVGIVRYRIPASVKSPQVEVNVESIVGVGADLKKVEIPTVHGRITVE